MREIIPPGVSGKQYHVYPPEIIQTNSLGRLRKSLERNESMYVASIYWNRE